MGKATDMRPPPTGSLLRFTAGKMVWPAFLAPLALPVALAAYSRFIAPLPDKDYAEVSALVILGTSVCIAALRWAALRQAYWAWLACLAASLLFREIHIDNTSVGADVIALCLLLYAWRYYPRFGAYLASPSVITLLSMALISYALAVGLDQGLFDGLTRRHFVPYLIEEYVEVFGHTCILLMTLCSSSTYNPLLDEQD